ncbi:MAG: GrpB family protein [Candidatus Moraniibacteriota bacterium]
MTFEFKKHSTLYSKRFEVMKNRISDLCPNKLMIEHIGSTAIIGLGGKGIIDISIGIKKWSEAEEVLKALRKLGFKHFHDIENHSIFVSTKAHCEENDFHVHIGRINTKRYKKTLDFRDILRKNPRLARAYSKIKKEAFQKSRENRKLYKRIKNDWFMSLDGRKF